MLHFLRGKIVSKGENFVILENQGFGFKIFLSAPTLAKLPANSAEIKLFCCLRVREEIGPELYGFLKEEELNFFNLLNSVAGVGPKTALGILSLDRLENLMAAIIENRPDLLTRASGIGRKTAERVVLELKNKIKLQSSRGLTEKLDSNKEIEEILVGLGYNRRQAQEVLTQIPPDSQTIEERVKKALSLMSRY